jgi:hypothetical protein
VKVEQPFVQIMPEETATADKVIETVRLALEIADENAKSVIECLSIFHQLEGVLWMEIKLTDEHIARELEYLKLRSLIEFHPEEKTWVRFVEAK